MPFYCLRCGECCSAMGDVHALEGDPSSGRCVVVNRYTGERTPVAVDPDNAQILYLPKIPGACPLFRRDVDGQGVCPVHETWPAVCAKYQCWRLLVLASDGRWAGRVMGHRHLAVDDADWDTVLVEALGSAGFRIIR